VLLAVMPFALSALLLIDISLLTQPAKASKALHLSASAIKTIGVLGLCLEAAWLVLVARRKAPFHIRGKTIQLPSLKHTSAQICVGVTQLSAIAGILYALMPAELNMSWPAFVGIYCIAFVAGQMSNVPAGLGVLEAALLLMLPQIPPGKLIGAILAYRGVFELLPLVVALVGFMLVEAGTKTRAVLAEDIKEAGA
jgi:phosphatidylglycerol lysyltransferase